MLAVRQRHPGQPAVKGTWRCDHDCVARAVESGIKAIESNPYVHSAYYNIAFHLLDGNETDQALDVYNRLIAIAPNYAQVHQNTGLIYYKMFGSTNDRKYLYQSILEFECATILENSFENHTKLIQLYSHLLNDLPRGQYHNQYQLWEADEDAYYLLSRLWRSSYAQPTTPEPERRSRFEEWAKGMYDYSSEYWRYRLQTARTMNRPNDEIQYIRHMGSRRGLWD